MDVTIPSLFALSERKTLDSYKQIFRVVLKFATERGLQDKFRIVRQKGQFYTDFERAPGQALHIILNVQIVLAFCWFHLRQAALKVCDRAGIRFEYNKSQALKEEVYMVCSLAFVPLPDLERGYAELEDFLKADGEAPSKALVVLQHLGDNYIFGKKRRDGKPGRGKPKFDPKLWNMFERVKTDLPLTTNGLEFWHSSIRSIMVESHSSMQRFISDLWKIALDVEARTELVLARIPSALPKRTPASAQEYDRRYDIITRYEEYPSILEYLTALSIRAEAPGLKPWE